MLKHVFTQKEKGPAEVYYEIKALLETEGFKIVSEELTDNLWDLHARKSSLTRIVLGAVRDADVIITTVKNEEKELVEVQLRIGVWGRDLAVPIIEGVATVGTATAAQHRSAHEYEENLWEKFVERLDPSLFVCHLDGIVLEDAEELESHTKMHRERELAALIIHNNPNMAAGREIMDAQI